MIGFSIVDLKAKRYLNSWNLKEIFAKYDKDNEGYLGVIYFLKVSFLL